MVLANTEFSAWRPVDIMSALKNGLGAVARVGACTIVTNEWPPKQDTILHASHKKMLAAAVALRAIK